METGAKIDLNNQHLTVQSKSSCTWHCCLFYAKNQPRRTHTMLERAHVHIHLECCDSTVEQKSKPADRGHTRQPDLWRRKCPDHRQSSTVNLENLVNAASQCHTTFITRKKKVLTCIGLLFRFLLACCNWNQHPECSSFHFPMSMCVVENGPGPCCRILPRSGQSEVLVRTRNNFYSWKPEQITATPICTNSPSALVRNHKVLKWSTSPRWSVRRVDTLGGVILCTSSKKSFLLTAPRMNRGSPTINFKWLMLRWDCSRATLF